MPFWLHRIEEHVELAGWLETPECTRSPRETFQRNCWITTECEDPFVTDVIRWLGDGHILWESDFPHPDSKYPHTTNEFMNLLPDQITMESKAKILWDNALDYYRFPDGYLPTEFHEATDLPLPGTA